MSSSGKALFDRVIDCRMGTVDVSGGLRVSFKAKKNIKPEPNTCEIKVYNLDQDSRDVLQHGPGGKLGVSLSAGYKTTGTTLLFLGEARSAYTEWDEAGNCITTVKTGDSEKEFQEARLHMTIGPSQSPDVALRAMVRALGVGEGNLSAALAALKSKGIAAMFGPGTAISGSVRKQITDFCRSAGLEWCVTDGKLVVLDRGKSLTGKAVELSGDTGLKGSPSVDFQPRSKTSKGGITVKARTFIIPELQPGRLVLFKSKSVSGLYRIEEVEWTGDTWDGPWESELTCRAY